MCPGGGRSGVSGGEHRAGAGFLQVAAECRIVMGAFFNEPGDLPPGENFFKVKELVKTETTGNHKATGGWNAFFVKELDGKGRHRVRIVWVKKPEALVHGDLDEFSPR